MDRIFQVFVSSTFEDLKDERSQVSNALAKAGYIAAGMELFPASDQQQLEFIQRIINRSDYYVVLVGARYGSLADNGRSFTENEFDFARSKGIPVLAFLPAAPESIPFGKVETDPDKREKLEAFKAKLKTGRLVEHWSTVDDLCLKVVTAVAHAMNLTPRAGWVRGDQAIDPKVLQDLERLRIENEELRTRLATYQDDSFFNPALIGPDDGIVVDFQILVPIEGSKTPKTIRHAVEIGLGQVYTSIFDEMREDPRESSICAYIAYFAALNERMTVEGATYHLTDDCRIMLRRQLEALNLIEVAITNDGFIITPKYNWIATKKGKAYAAARLAQAKPGP
ncbi:DUF4062 domain-containing protein [Bradyrhizobium sp. 4]|uniref:DUF4062 domain-containing protein n=1 Tax=unclassified Bradyrhizobium TaxID=2631580 RepID=UPI001FF9BC9D|nr:DUF4062 domain-containing protein [Bradyrhizobium sp. 4]MCK1402334.1 DUF4062 domain-containing protein [Bradyrhizobium sp. 39]MCK1747929.1 DUF4062 domain-containing protein [Bradyrhizobium sp. 135]UPJ32423.1 DUF4062 domain-containing protein [Bradyrhizobium sp. 4]